MSTVRWAWVLAALVASTACGRDSAPTKTAAPQPEVPVPAVPVSPTATPPTATPPAASLPAAFTASLRRAGMTFTMPAGFTQVPTTDNPQWRDDFAMRSADETVEIRIRVDPLDEQVAEYARCKQGTSCGLTDPNARKTVWLRAIAGNIGGGMGLPSINELPADRMRQDYGADYGAVTEVVPDAVMKTTHRQALVVLLHKDDRADAVFAVLHDGLRPEQVPVVLQGLRFTP